MVKTALDLFNDPFFNTFSNLQKVTTTTNYPPYNQVKLNDKEDLYEAYFANLGLNRIPIADAVIREHQKLLSSGVWCILTLGYVSTDEKGTSPWVIETIKPIQISISNLDEFKEGRNKSLMDLK